MEIMETNPKYLPLDIAAFLVSRSPEFVKGLLGYKVSGYEVVETGEIMVDKDTLLNWANGYFPQWFNPVFEKR